MPFIYIQSYIFKTVNWKLYMFLLDVFVVLPCGLLCGWYSVISWWKRFFLFFFSLWTRLRNLAAGTLLVFLSPFSICQAKYCPELSVFISASVFPKYFSLWSCWNLVTFVTMLYLLNTLSKLWSQGRRYPVNVLPARWPCVFLWLWRQIKKLNLLKTDCRSSQCVIE